MHSASYLDRKVTQKLAWIDCCSQQLHVQSQSPQEALRAPLRAVAEFLGPLVLAKPLQAALALQETPVPEVLSAVERLHTAVRNLIHQGCRHKVAIRREAFHDRIVETG